MFAGSLTEALISLFGAKGELKVLRIHPSTRDLVYSITITSSSLYRSSENHFESISRLLKKKALFDSTKKVRFSYGALV